MAAIFLLIISATTVYSMPTTRSAIDPQVNPDGSTSSDETGDSNVAQPRHSVMDAAMGFFVNFTNDFDLNSKISRAVNEKDFESLANITLPAEKVEARQLPSYLRQQAIYSSCGQYCFDRLGQIYCCQNRLPTINLKRGACPKIRDYCPQSFGRNIQPLLCFEDSYCAGPDKCCYDVCVGTHVCKTPIVKVIDTNQNINQLDDGNQYVNQYNIPAQYNNSPNQIANQLASNVLPIQYGGTNQYLNQQVNPNVIPNQYGSTSPFVNQQVSPNVLPIQYGGTNQFVNQQVSPNVIPIRHDSTNQFVNQQISPNAIPNQYGSTNQFVNGLPNQYGNPNLHPNLFNVPNPYPNQYPMHPNLYYVPGQHPF